MVESPGIFYTDKLLSPDQLCKAFLEHIFLKIHSKERGNFASYQCQDTLKKKVEYKMTLQRDYLMNCISSKVN